MRIDYTPLDDIDESMLQQLVDDRVSERKTIEYKESLFGNKDSEKKEFLADVTSFANASGGHLIYGIKAKEGLPIELVGVDVENADAALLRLDNLIRDGIQPRIFGTHTKAIPLSNGKTIILIRIPKSWSPPHMVTLQQHFKFYSRNSAGKYPLDVSELRSIYSLSGELAERIKKFQHERLASIVAGETQLPLASDSFIALHIFPFSALEHNATVDLPGIMKLNPRPMSSYGWDNRYNFDGILTYRPIDKEGNCSAYTQIFRSGIIEAVTTNLFGSKAADKFIFQTIPTSEVESVILTSTRDYLNILDKVNITVPYSILISLINIKGFVLTSQYAYWDDCPIDKDNLLLPEVLVMERGNGIAPFFKHAFDALWNAVGIASSPNFSEDGTWRGSEL